MTLGGLAAAFGSINLLRQVVYGTMWIGSPTKDGWATSQMESQAGQVDAVRVLATSIALAWGITLYAGGHNMKTLRNLGWARTAAIVAMIPLNVCWLFGLPVGIWALVALGKPEVAEAFGKVTVAD
jgi:hypothetical protein